MRRALIAAALAVGAVAGACSAASLAGPGPAPGSEPAAVAPTSAAAPTVALTPSPSPSPSPSPVLELPAVPLQYEPLPGDVEREVKRVAGDAVQTLLTYGPDDTPDEVTAAVGAGPGATSSVLTAAQALVLPETGSRATIRYAQLGGYTELSASVMVVTEQQIYRIGQEPEVLSRAIDVRVDRGSTTEDWGLALIAATGGTPTPVPPDLSPTARAVLEDPRIELADSTRWDIAGGGISEQLLSTMLAMAEQARFSVTVVATGHPPHVWATDRLSNHAEGRAVDVWAVDGQAVVEQRTEGSAAHRMARFLFDQGVPELGSPWAFDGYGGRSFTDLVHQDHLHVGFDA